MPKPNLDMDHLMPPSSDELLASVKAEAETKTVKADPRDQERWSFDFSWTDARGTKWDGTFTNKILGFDELQQVAVLKSRTLMGQPLSSFEPDMLNLTTAVAHMMLSLVESPSWAKDLRKLKDPALLYKIWEKVDSHEAHFFRLGADASSSQSE